MTDELRSAAEAATPGPDALLPFDIETWLITIKAHCTVIADPGDTDDPAELAQCIKLNIDTDLRPVLLAQIARLAALEAENARLREALTWYANPEIYKPHPHGIAFDARDLSFRAKAELARLPTREEG